MMHGHTYIKEIYELKVMVLQEIAIDFVLHSL